MAITEDKAGQGGHFIEASGVNFYYEVHGEGQPLLLLHAGSLTCGMWQPYLADFVTRFCVIAPDLPNHGRSGKPERPLSYRRLADEIVAFIRALELVRPVIVGFSDGGQVALEIGIRYPATLTPSQWVESCSRTARRPGPSCRARWVTRIRTRLI